MKSERMLALLLLVVGIGFIIASFTRDTYILFNFGCGVGCILCAWGWWFIEEIEAKYKSRKRRQ